VNEFKTSHKSLIQLGFVVHLFVLAASATVSAQQVTLSVGSGSGAPGTTVTVPITITTSGSPQPAALQWTMAYSSADISSVTVTAGSSATAASKSVSCSSSSSTTTICIAYGLNTNIFSSGTLASATFTIASGSPDPSTAIQLSGVMATDAMGDANAISASGTGGSLVISQPGQPTQGWTISGSVGSSVLLTLTGTSTATTTANASNTYAFSNLTNGSYVVTPSLAGFTFSPTSAVVTVNGANVTVPPFVATRGSQSWTISGTVGSSVLLTLTGTSMATTTANASNTYAFSNLTNGSYVVTPSLAGFTFSPSSATVTVNGANVTVPPFVATWAAQTWTISGSVGSSVLLTLTGTSMATTTANASNTYTFSGVANGSYVVTPSLAGFTFSPTSAVVTVNGANVTVPPFIAAWATITGAVGTEGIGATLTLAGTSTATTTADTSGAYKFSGLANGSYTITPAKSGYTFNPASAAVTINGTNVTPANFTVQATLTSITIDATVSQDSSTSSDSIAVSGLSTVSGNELLLAFVAARDVSTHVEVTGVSGGGLTWVSVERTRAQPGTGEIWRAFAPTTLEGVSVTATLSESAPVSMTVMSFAGVNTTGTFGSGAIGATRTVSASSGAPSATLITTQNNSWVIGVGTDMRGVTARTVASNQTMVHQDLASTTDTYWVQRMTSTTPLSGTSVTINDSAPTGDPYNLSIVEILAAQSVGSQTTGLATPAAVTPTPKPTIRNNSLAPGASLVLATITTGQAAEACSPGGLASLLGAGLTGTPTERSNSQPLPTQLAGIQVLVNGVPAPLLLASDSQINFQCPVLAQGATMQIQVESTKGVLTPPLQAVMQAAVPVLFQMDASRRGLVTIAGTNEIALAQADGIQSRPALPGESLTIHASGLGEVVDGVLAGTAAPLSRPVPTKNQIKLVLSDIEIDPEFAGLAPGTVGVYQVNAQVPSGAPAGVSIPLYLKMTLADGTIVRSNTVTMAIGDTTRK
jgi:uncharacterized protein (TIGR03437 family)